MHTPSIKATFFSHYYEKKYEHFHAVFIFTLGFKYLKESDQLTCSVHTYLISTIPLTQGLSNRKQHDCSRGACNTRHFALTTDSSCTPVSSECCIITYPSLFKPITYLFVCHLPKPLVSKLKCQHPQTKGKQHVICSPNDLLLTKQTMQAE